MIGFVTAFVHFFNIVNNSVLQAILNQNFVFVFERRAASFHIEDTLAAVELNMENHRFGRLDIRFVKRALF